jgi:hypothetical protein
MNRRARSIALSFLTLLLAASVAINAAAYKVLRGYAWVEVRSASVRAGGRVQPQARVLRSPTNDTAIVMADGGIYVTDGLCIGLASSGCYWRLPGAILFKQPGPPAIALDGSEAKADNFDAHLALSPRRLTFRTLDRPPATVEVNW